MDRLASRAADDRALRAAAALERRRSAAAVWAAIQAERHSAEAPGARLRAMLLAGPQDVSEEDDAEHRWR